MKIDKSNIPISEITKVKFTHNLQSEMILMNIMNYFMTIKSTTYVKWIN